MPFKRTFSLLCKHVSDAHKPTSGEFPWGRVFTCKRETSQVLSLQTARWKTRLGSTTTPAKLACRPGKGGREFGTNVKSGTHAADMDLRTSVWRPLRTHGKLVLRFSSSFGQMVKFIFVFGRETA